MNSTVHIYPINGAVHQVQSDATAFAYRDASFATVIAGMWPDPADNEQNTQWVRDYYDATAPHSEEGGYVNFMADDDQGRVQSNYKGNYDRLARLKREYDPGNLFRFNQNIQPGLRRPQERQRSCSEPETSGSHGSSAWAAICRSSPAATSSGHGAVRRVSMSMCRRISSITKLSRWFESSRR